jgi:hypothetical protein
MAAVKVGTKCSTIGKTVIVGKDKLTCAKVSEYKWVATPIKPVVGSVFNPVQPGSKLKINSLVFQTGEVNFDFGNDVCQENAFNDGCLIDSDVFSSVDPSSPNRWVGINLNILNQGVKKVNALDLYYSFYLILPNGKYLENASGVTYENAPIDITLLPNTSSKMRVAFSLPKSVENLNPIIIVRDDSGTTTKDYFFYITW